MEPRADGERQHARSLWAGGLLVLLGILVGGGLVLLTIRLMRPGLVHWPVGEVVVGERLSRPVARGCAGQFAPRADVEPELEPEPDKAGQVEPIARAVPERPTPAIEPEQGPTTPDDEQDPLSRPAPVSPVLIPSGAVVVEAPAGSSASVRGVVHFTGQAPRALRQNRSADPYCQKTAGFDETVLVNANRTLRNVVVRIVGAPPSPAPSSPAVIEQRDCTYQPHVLAARNGQPVQIRNADGTLHNLHLYKNSLTIANQAQIAGSRPVNLSLRDTSDDALYHLKCDVHPWMNAWLSLHDNDYFALTDESGAYEIKNVPPGRHVIEAWHERFGKKQAAIIIGEDRPEVSFTFNGTEVRTAR